MNTVQDNIIELAPLADMRTDTLRRLEEAVQVLFSGRDLHEVSMMDIARQANVSLQTIYKYFGSKEVLVYTLLNTMLSRLAVRMVDHLQGIEDFKERLRKTFWVMLDYFDQHPKVLILFFNVAPAQSASAIPVFEHPDLINPFMGLFKEGQKRGVLNDAVSSKVLLDVFLGILGRVAHMHIVRGETTPLTAQMTVLFDMLWRALSKPSTD